MYAAKYAATVGKAIPKIIQPIPVTIKAIHNEPTLLIISANSVANPDITTIPIIIPAAAVGIATWATCFVPVNSTSNNSLNTRPSLNRKILIRFTAPIPLKAEYINEDHCKILYTTIITGISKYSLLKIGSNTIDFSNADCAKWFPLAMEPAKINSETTYATAGMIAARAISLYGIPVISAIINAPTPIIGGITCPLVEATASIAPACSGLYPTCFIKGIVITPVVVTFATALPLIIPNNELLKIAAFAAPPEV